MAGPETTALSETCLDRVLLRPLSEVPEISTDLCSRIYFDAWINEGIPLNFEQTLNKVPHFNPETSYCLINEESGLPIAVIHTILVRADSLQDLLGQFPGYSAVEDYSLCHRQISHPNIRLCFSITALPCHKVKWQDKYVSSSQFIMKNLPEPQLHAIAYSRFSQIKSSPDLLTHYLSNLNTPKNLGPVGMHEYLGGLAIAMIEGSRPEDIRAGQGNVLVLYPSTSAEAVEFQKIKSLRRQTPPHHVVIGPCTIFTDCQMDNFCFRT